MNVDEWETLGLENLAEFVAATAGRRGTVHRSDNGTFIASPVPVAHGYLNAVIPAADVDPEQLLDAAEEFFSEHRRGYVIWSSANDEMLHDIGRRRGGRLDDWPTPAMRNDTPIPCSDDLTIDAALDTVSHDTFGRIAEDGYETPGFGWTLNKHDAYMAPRSTWLIAYDGDRPVGVATAFLHHAIGGIYNVATPAAERGRGVGARVTAAANNTLLATGATSVILQSSKQGMPVYERLGFRTVGHLRRLTFDPPSGQEHQR